MQPTRRIAVLAIVLAAATAPSRPRAEAPPSPIPDTPAGRRFADLMRLTDAGDASAIASYVEAHFTEGMRRTDAGDRGIARFLVDQATRFHGFEVVRAIASRPDQAVMLVRPRSQPDRWLRYIVKVQDAPPHEVEGLFLMPAEPKDIPKRGSPLSADEAVAALAKEVERAIAVDGFSGVVLLAHGDTVAYAKAAGVADRDHGVPVTMDTVFKIASMSKMFTAVAVARLVEEGKLSWSDPVGRYLHGWLPDGLGATVTVDRLLTHRAGLGDYLDRIEDDPKIRNARSISDYRDLVRSSKVEAVPDGEMRYSNTGYLVLGALIEAVSGESYFDFVKKEVFDRAGMTSSAWYAVDDVVPNRAIGYVPPAASKAAGLGTGWHSNVLLLGARGTSAGGGYATAPDLLRFARALAGGKLVKPATLDALLTPRVRFPVGGDYAYGFIVHRGKDGKRLYGHAGGFPGESADLEVYGDGAWTLIVLSNVSGGAGEIVGTWDGIAARLAPEP